MLADGAFLLSPSRPPPTEPGAVGQETASFSLCAFVQIQNAEELPQRGPHDVGKQEHKVEESCERSGHLLVTGGANSCAIEAQSTLPTPAMATLGLCADPERAKGQ